MKKLVVLAMTMMMALANVTTVEAKVDETPKATVETRQQESVEIVGKIYPMTTVVNRVENGTVYCVDFNGNEWAFSEDEYEWVDLDWSEGDYCSMIMDTMGTDDTVYDDRIISYTYDGWMCGYYGFDGEGNVMEYWH